MLASLQRSERRVTAAGHGIDWPTLALAVAVYLAFGALTWWHAALPWWLILPAGAYLVCLHGSLQHEAVHGHPTPWPRVNEALVFPSLWLWMPFRSYRTKHLIHHRNEMLTDPREDPESMYVTPEAWAAMGPWRRGFHLANNTFLGRLTLGPLVSVWRFWRDEIGRPDDNLIHIGTNLRYGCTILKYYLDKENGDLRRALSRYNGSLGRRAYPNRVIDKLTRKWFRG